LPRTFGETSIEDVERYWDARPCNIRHSTRPIGSAEYFDEVEARKYRVEPHIPSFAEFDRWKGKRVLEIGCGIGTDTINFARHGARVTAVDLSENSLAIARQRAEVFGLQDRICFYRANVEQLSEFLPVESYDLVYSFGVLHHTPHPSEALAEVRKYIRPGGTLKIMVYHRRSWKVLWILLAYGGGKFWHLNRLVATYSEAQTGCPVTYVYSRGQARRWLQHHGFRITDMRVEHIFPYRIKDYVQYRYTVVWYFRWLPARAFRWLERTFGWHLCLTARAAE
jgi:2-polyprenyl-3-methyl-5-hydroxy-6-metoxy-1,4-benzoquinol methylase